MISNGRGCTRMQRNSAYPRLPEPGSEQLLDVAAAARGLEPALHALVLDDHDGRHLADAEALGQFGVLVDVDVVELERPVVAPPLQHLREVPLDATRAAGVPRVEEHEAGAIGDAPGGFGPNPGRRGRPW